ncbi:MAG: hypothetical protein AB7V42_15930 [Thermoleophilia bacterium]
MPRTNRTLRAVLAAAALATAATAAGPATGATVVTPNACQYSYDGYWRNIPVTLEGTAPATASPGATITTSGQATSAELPTWLGATGYQFGLFALGTNDFPATVWVAVQATNTAERIQTVRLETTAHVTISLNELGQPQASAITYDPILLPNFDWRSTRGPVEVRQAPAGSLPPIPVGPGGGLQKPDGSFYIRAELGALNLGLDCLPGAFTADGGSHSNQTAAPYASVDVRAFDVIGDGAALADDRVDVRITGDDQPSGQPGQARTIQPTVTYTLSDAYLDDLDLPQGTQPISLDVSAAIDGGGTAPARQVATTRLTGAVTVGGAGDAAGPVTLSGALSPTSWTPLAGATALTFSAGPVGSLPGAAGSIRAAGTIGPRDVTLDAGSGDAVGASFTDAVQLDPFLTLWIDEPPVVRPTPQPPGGGTPPPAATRTTTRAPAVPKLKLATVRGRTRLTVTAALAKALAGRRVAIERRVGAKVYNLATVKVPKTGKIKKVIALKRAARTGKLGIKGAKTIRVRLRVTQTATATAAAGRYRTLKVTRAALGAK